MFSEMKAWEMGFLPYWMKINIQKAPKCFTKKRPETAKKKPIGMDDLFGAFLILGVGLGLATMAFFMENLISCYQRMA
jgi:ionotropic glutamate receptor